MGLFRYPTLHGVLVSPKTPKFAATDASEETLRTCMVWSLRSGYNKTTLAGTCITPRQRKEIRFCAEALGLVSLRPGWHRASLPPSKAYPTLLYVVRGFGRRGAIDLASKPSGPGRRDGRRWRFRGRSRGERWGRWRTPGAYGRRARRPRLWRARAPSRVRRAG
jgi:hypothetical protein